MYVLLCLLVVGTGASVGILSSWAASSRQHWFVRMLAVALPLSVLLTVPAYEPFVALVVEALVIAGGLLAVRWFRSRRQKGSLHTDASSMRFSVASLLSLMLLAGMIAALAVRLPRLSATAWLNTINIGAAVGLAVLAGIWLARGRMRWWKRLQIVAAAAMVVAAPLAASDYFLNSFARGGAPWPPPGFVAVPAYDVALHWLWIALLPAVSLVIALSLLLATHSRSAEKSKQQFGNHCSAVGALAMLLWSGLLVALPAYVLYRVLTPTPIPARTYPQPNGWNSLTAAMKAIQSPYFVEYDSAKPAAFDIAFQEKPGGYARLRDALTHDSLARFDFHIPFLESRDHVHLQDFRWLARAVSTEAERAAFEERLDDAAAIYADSIELGQRITSDGMLIHALVGAAIQNMGNRGLAKVRHRLPPTVSTRIARRLFEIEERREPFPRLLSNDRIWMQHALGWHGRTTLALADFAGEELEVHTIVRRAYLRATMLMRLLITELAIQAYADEHGQPPAHLEMVWPDIVPSAVIDPFSGRPLRYRKSGTDWLVYSVGYDRDDDGGRPPGNQDHVTWEDGDISLDGWWKWLDDQGAYWP